MRTLSILLNLEIVVSTLIGSYMRLRPRNGRTTAERASTFFRFFTTLSNELAAFAALLILAAPGASFFSNTPRPRLSRSLFSRCSSFSGRSSATGT